MSDPVFRPAEHVVACELEGGKALLDLETSTYYKLNHSAALIWEWIGDGAGTPDLVARMLDCFEVGEDECKQDVEAIIDSFCDAGLLETEDRSRP